MKKVNKPQIILNDVHASGNGGDGFRIEGDIPIEMKNVTSQQNGGKGLHLIGTTKSKWLVTPIRIVVGVATAVIAGLILAFGFGVGR